MYLGKTYFSFKYGCFSTKELVAAGVEAGVSVLTLANINSTCDAWDFVQDCQEQGIKPILGVEIRNADQFLYTLIAANNNGFRWINEFLSEHLLEKSPFPPRTIAAPFFSILSDGFVIYSLQGKSPEELFDNERIGVLPGEVNKLLKMPLNSYSNKWVIRQPVTFQNKTYYNLHRLLRAIDKNTLPANRNILFHR
jgi:DNA polymerase III alpha subunit